MARYIDETDVYKLVEPRGVAKVHCSQIDELPRADVVPKSEYEKIFAEIDILIDDWKHNRIQSIQFIAELAELKKKYTEEVEIVRDLVEYVVDQDIQNYKENN